MPTIITGETGVNQITDGVITANDLASGSVTTAKIGDTNITQAKLAAGVVGNGPAFYAYLGSQQAISGSTMTKISLNGELFDTASCFDSSTNYRFTPNVAGYYQINGAARIIGASGTNKVLVIYKNGSQLYSSDTYSGSSGNLSQYLYTSISGLVYMNGSSDYIELWGYSNGTSNAFDGGAGGANTPPWQTFMSGSLVRAA